MSQYYYRKPSGDRGPFSVQELEELYQKGSIDEHSLIRKINEYDWCSLTECRDIFPFMEKENQDVSRGGLVEYLSNFGFLHLDPTQFEEFVMRIFEALGLKGNLTPVTGDGGIDIELISPHGKKAIAQCKRYNSEQTIGVRDVRELLGAMVHSNSSYGFFVTTSTYTEQAIDLSKGKPLVLIDGSQFKKLFLMAVDSERDPSLINSRIIDPINRIVGMVLKR